MPMQVAAILAHKLVHAATGVAAGHRKEFRHAARGIGLVGQMATTTAGPEFKQALRRSWQKQGHCPMAGCSGRLALAAIPTDAKDDTQVRSSALAAPAAVRFIPRADGSAWQGYHSVPNTDR